MQTQDSSAPEDLAPTRMCLVYDRRNGRIVHAHAFVPAEPGDEMTDEELHDHALAAASVGEIPRDSLAVTTAPPEFHAPNAPLGKVDPASGAYLPASPRTEDVKREKKSKDKGKGKGKSKGKSKGKTKGKTKGKSKGKKTEGVGDK